MSDMLAEETQDSAGVEYIGFWKRFIAYIIDGIIMTVLIFLLAPKGNLMEALNSDGLDMSLITAASEDFAPVSLAVTLVYLVGLWAWRQATLGLMIFGARIADATTYEKPGIDKLLRRVILFILPGVLAFVSQGLGSAANLLFIISCIWVAIDERKQGLHDKIGGTVMIRK